MHSKKSLIVTADYASFDVPQVRRAIQEGIDRFGRLDVIINNAGRGITRNPSELTDEDIDEMMAINVKSALYGMQACQLPSACSRSCLNRFIIIASCNIVIQGRHNIYVVITPSCIQPHVESFCFVFYLIISLAFVYKFLCGC